MYSNIENQKDHQENAIILNSFKRTFFSMLRTSAIFAGLSILLMKYKGYKENIYILTTVILITIINSVFYYINIVEHHHIFKLNLLYSIVIIIILGSLLFMNYKLYTRK